MSATTCNFFGSQDDINTLKYYTSSQLVHETTKGKRIYCILDITNENLYLWFVDKSFSTLTCHFVDAVCGSADIYLWHDKTKDFWACKVKIIFLEKSGQTDNNNYCL